MFSFNTTKTRLGLRSKVIRVVVAALVGTLVVPLGSFTFPWLTSSAQAAQLTTLAAPTVTSVTTTNGGLLVTWTAPASYTGSSAVTGYRVEYSTDGSTYTVASSSISSATLSYAITNLTENTNYFVRVAAMSSADYGAYGYLWSKLYSTSTVVNNSAGKIVYDSGFGLSSTTGQASNTLANATYSRVRYEFKMSSGAAYANVDFQRYSANTFTNFFFSTTETSRDSTIPNLAIPDMVNQIGVKTNVTDMNVYSSASTLNTAGANGFLEIWNSSYVTAKPTTGTAATAFPHGDGGLFDSNDTPQGNGWGSFQVFNRSTGTLTTPTTVFAWNGNATNYSGGAELGIGTNTVNCGFGVSPDWTGCKASTAQKAGFGLSILINPVVKTGTFIPNISYAPFTGAAGSSVSVTPVSSGSTITAYSVSAGTPLPSTLNLNTSTGVISGTAPASGTYTYTINAVDGASRSTTANFVLTVQSNDATLSATTIKGVTPTLGTPNSTLSSAIAGAVTLTSSQALSTTASTFTNSNSGATTKIVKYTTGTTADTANFDAATNLTSNTTITVSNGDYFIIKVTAENSTVNFYRINLTVVSDDATLSAATIKGVIPTLGTPNSVLASVTAGTVGITNSQALGTSASTFTKSNSGATTKIVKYSSSATADTANFDAATDLTASTTTTVSNGDYFIIKVTAENLAVNYYRITATVLSNDATLSAATVKGVTPTLGIPNSTLTSVTAGVVSLTTAQGTSTSLTSTFTKSDSGATPKIVKYSSSATADTANFDAATDLTASTTTTVSNGDYFIIKVTAADSTVNYYRITVTVLSNDATLSAATVKGVTPTLGTPNSVLASVTAGTVSLTATEATSTSLTSTFTKSNSGAITKLVKYSSGTTAGTANFDAATDLTASTTTTVSNGDYFIIKVTAADSTVLYYRITVTAPIVITTANVVIAAAVAGQTPQTSTTSNGQFTTTISWSPSVTRFAVATAYTATVTVIPDAGYTLTGVTANFFTLNGKAATSGNTANAGVFSYLFGIQNAICFNGSNQSLSLNTHSNLPTGNTAYTIEAFFKSDTSHGGAFTSWGTAGEDGSGRGQRNVLSFDNTINGYIHWNQKTFARGSSKGNVIFSNTWNHVVAQSDGSNVRIYENGILIDSKTYVSNVVTTSNFRIGSTSAGTNFFKGCISNLRIVKGVAVYGGTNTTTANFAVPTSDLTAIQSSSTNISAITGTQTVLLMNRSSNILLEDSSFGGTLTANGTPTTSYYGPFVPSSDATLSALVLSAGTLSATFASLTTSYTASVANSVSSITVTPTRNQANATITVNGTSVTSGSASGAISLSVGSNPITVIVTAQDGSTTKSYSINVTRAASNDATLSALALSAGTLSPTFASGTTSYTASVANADSSITVTPTRTEANSTITVNGTSVASGSASGAISLSVGSNTITVVVTAQDGVTTNSYTVFVTRAEMTITTANVTVTAPVRGATPQTSTTSNSQFTTTITWSGTPTTFAGGTTYTAQVTVVPVSGYTLTGVTANFFTLNGNTATTGNSANAGVFSYQFTATDTLITTKNVVINAPAAGSTPQTSTTSNGQFTTTISWSPSVTRFAVATAYTATVTIVPDSGYSLTGISANFFTLNGKAATSGNTANAGVFSYLFGIQNAICFNGSNQSLSLNTHSNLPTGNTAYTIEAFFKSGTSHGGAFTSWGTAGEDGSGRGQRNTLSFDNTINGYIHWNQKTFARGSSKGNVIFSNTWNHVVAQSDGSNVRIYENGILVDSKTYESNVVTTSNFRIGSTSTGSNFFNGCISNLRIVKGVAVYGGTSTTTANFAVPTSDLTDIQSSSTNISAITGTQTVLLMNRSSNILLEDSSFGGTLTANGTPTTSYDGPFVPSSDATLSASSIKGVTPTLGTPNSSLSSVMAGAVTLTEAQATSTSLASTFTKRVSGATTKVVKYSSGTTADVTNFDAATDLTASTTTTLSNGDYFIIKVTAVDLTEKYYRITITTAAVITLPNVVITAPVTGATPQTSTSSNGQFSTTITWSGTPTTFAAGTAYTATVTVTPEAGRTLTGVSANFFKVNDNAATSANLANAGVFEYLFSATAPAPTITNLDQTLPNYGTTVNVTGTNLSGATVVKIGNTPVATFTVVSATSLSFVVNSVCCTVSTISITTPGGTVTSVATITPQPQLAVIATQPTAVSGTVGQSVTFSVVATTPLDGGVLSYQWINGTTPIQGATSATFTFTPTAVTQAGNYYVAVYNTVSGSTSLRASNTAALSLGKATPVLSAFAAVNKTFGDASFTITAPASSVPGGFSYQSGTTSVATVSGSTITIVGQGSSVITATFTPQNTDDYLSNVTITMTLAVAAPKFTVTYFGNNNTGGTAPTDSAEYLNGASVSVSGVGTLVRTGYNFTGWTTDSANTSTLITAASSITINQANVQLYAKWQAIPYTVIFNSQGGSSVTNGSYTIGGTITLPSDPTRAGYTFNGWFLNSTGGTALVSSYSPPSTGNLTLFAQWTPIQYTVTYNGNLSGGGTAPVNSSTYTVGSSIPVVGNTGTLTKTGYTFSDWTLNSQGSGSVYASGSTYTAGTSNITFYARWIATPYSVTYNSTSSTGGSAPTDTSTYTIGQNLPVRGNLDSLVRTGYTFSGWTDNSGGSGTVYSSGNNYVIGSANVSFYPKWAANSYNITYNKNGASGLPTASTATYTTGGDAVTLTSVGTMAKTGYNFGGWSTTSTGSAISGTYTTTADVILYAVWNIKSISVTYSEGSATRVNLSGFPSNASGNYGTTITLNATISATTVIDSAQHAFIGWSDGSSVYQGGASYLLGETSPTFTAVWAKIFAVRYAFNGGTPAAGTSDTDSECLAAGNTCTDGQLITAHAAPTRTGYSFAGWVDQNNVAVSGSTFNVASNRYLLYATWTAENYSITYSTAGGSTPEATFTKQLGQSFTVAAAPTKTGHTFAGWSDGTTIVNPGVTYYVATSPITLTAQWTTNVYTISFDPNGGSGTAISNVSYTYGGTAISLPTVGDLVRTNYTFAGWSETPTGTSVGTTYAPTMSRTLYVVWTISQYVVTYGGNGGTPSTASGTYSPGSSPLVLPTASRANFTFQGWYSAATDGVLIGLAGATYAPASATTIYARWIQDSLAGVPASSLSFISSYAVNPAITATSTFSTSDSAVSITIPAGSLPTGTTVTNWLLSSQEHAQAVLPGENNYVLSLVVSWLNVDGTVPEAPNSKPLVMTITNSSIKAGARVYSVVGSNVQLLGVATQDGSVSVNFTTDPQIYVLQSKPGAPTNVVATSGDQSSSVVTWSAPADDGGSTIINYTVTASDGQSCISANTTCNFGGLTDGTSYTFTVSATNGVGSSDQSAASAAITPGVQTPVVVAPTTPTPTTPTPSTPTPSTPTPSTPTPSTPTAVTPVTPTAPVAVRAAFVKAQISPQIRKSGDQLMCTPGTYSSGYTINGVIEQGTTSVFTPVSYIYNILFNLVVQSSISVTTTKNSATWDQSLAPAGALVTCSVTVTNNSLTATENSIQNTAATSAALAAQKQSITTAEAEYKAAQDANAKGYQKALVDNRAKWRADIAKNKATYDAERDRIKKMAASKSKNALTSAALKKYTATQKKITADYKASGPAAVKVRDLANKSALDTKNAAIEKANSAYASLIESLGYGVVIP